MPFHSTRPACLLLITLLAAPGCWTFSFGGDDGDETGDTGWSSDWGDDDDEPPGPAVPSRTDPLVSGALWSIRWDTAHALDHAALADYGLALANGAHCALLDPDTGEPLWGLPADDDTNSVLRLRADQIIHGRRIEIAEQWTWQLGHYSITGELEATRTFDGPGPLVVDGGGRAFMMADEQLTALDDDDQPLWSRSLTPESSFGELFAVDDGVVLVELGSLDDIEVDYHLRRFAADGEELPATGFVHDLSFINDLALADGRTYVATRGVFGLPGLIHAVEPEFAGLTWTLDLGSNTEVHIEPGLGGGLIAMIAEPEEPARVTWIDADGTVLESRDATTDPVIHPLLIVGAAGEVIAGGFVDGQMQLSRIE